MTLVCEIEENKNIWIESFEETNEIILILILLTRLVGQLKIIEKTN